LLPVVALLAALAAGGCAPLPPAATARDPVAGAPIDLAAKHLAPRDGRKRDRAAISAQYHLELEADENGPPSVAQLFRANAQRTERLREGAGGLQAKSAGIDPGRWEAIGPANVGGRVRALVFDPRNSRRVFAGTASGGLWLTEDGGATWQRNSDFLPNLSVSTIAVDPTAPDTMYLGTGEASAGLVGVGAFKSVDGGRTWAFLESTHADANPDWRFVNRLAAHPREPGTLLAALTSTSLATGAIYRSTDGGASWRRVATMKALDVAFDPHAPANAVAGLDDGTIAYSRDAGVTWTRTAALVASPAGRGNTARAEIAFARSAPGVVYASVDNDKGEVWRSNDAGATWTLRSTPQHLGTQGDYDNAIWVDPTDANHLVVGGLDLHRSEDGAATFTRVSDWRLMPQSPHADHHAIVSPPDYGPSNRAVWNGNDGGVYRAADITAATAFAGGGWTNMNNGLAVTQFYSGAGRTAAGGRIVGGTQDNGSLLLSGSQWRMYRGGDGGTVAVDPASDRWIFGEYVYLALHRSSDGGATSSFICNGISEGLPAEGSQAYCGSGTTKQANFIAPFVLDPNNAERLLAGGASLWVTDNAKAPAPSWRTIKQPSTVTENFINAIAVAEAGSNATWVGHNNGEVYRSLDALAAVPTWIRVGQGALPARRVQRILVDKDDARRAIVAFTGFTPANLWETRDAGATWASITGNLPAAPIFDVKRHPARPDWLYAATSVGLFTSEDGGATWSTTNEGPANIRVRELFWLDDATLGVATYGRGMFKTAVTPGPANYQDLWWGGLAENGWGMSISQRGATLFVALFIYDASGKPLWVVMPGGTWNAGFTAYTGSLYLPSGSFFGAYDASRFSPGPPVGSATITFSGPATATLAYSVNGVSGTKSIQRQRFGAPDATPTGTLAGLWWGGERENGWGVSISQQYRSLFAVWYTYDAAGRTTWFVVPGGTWTAANAWSGTAYRTTGSAWLGAAYDPGAFNPVSVGSMGFSFANDAGSATMTYDLDGVKGTKSLVRQPF
jgi:hypothetical protein